MLLLAGCVRYVPLAAPSPAVAQASFPVESDVLTFEEAVRLLARRHPELMALRADARAVNLAPGPEPLVLGERTLDGELRDVTLQGELLSLLGVGPVAAERALAQAVRSAQLRLENQRARELVADLARAVVVHRALAGIETPQRAVDLDTFEQAGLLSGSAKEAARAAVDEAQAEREVIALASAESQRQMQSLVGARPEGQMLITGPEAAWPPVPESGETAALLCRGDVLHALAAYHVADHQLRLAIAKQTPSIDLKIGGDVELGALLQMIQIRVPLDAPAVARAAGAAREAARQRFRRVLLDALHDAARARLAWDRAGAERRAAESRVRAARALVEAARARIDTDPSSIPSYVLVLGEEVGAARALRAAIVRQAEARVDAARAAGWPSSLGNLTLEVPGGA
jgi:outer membrane protein TolC